jgi:hypothetical protein
MRGRIAGIRERLTYANVMATIAVFGVLAGGGAWAAGTIGPGDIQANAVRSGHIKNHQVRKPDLASSAVPFGGTGSIHVASDRTLSETPSTLMKLPGIGKLTAACAASGPGTSFIHLKNQSGKTLAVDLISGFHGDGSPVVTPNDARYEVAQGGEQQLVAGLYHGNDEFGDAVVSITAANGSRRPQAMGTLSAQLGCGSPGFVTALVITSER